MKLKFINIDDINHINHVDDIDHIDHIDGITFSSSFVLTVETETSDNRFDLFESFLIKKPKWSDSSFLKGQFVQIVLEISAFALI